MFRPSSLVFALGLVAVSLTACKKNEAAAPDAAAVDAAPAAVEDAAPASSAAAIDAAPAAPVHAGPVALPGACVDPMADAKGRFTGPGPLVAGQPDLDGDGKPDKILTFMTSDSVANPFVVYVMRGACGHFVGSFKVGSLVVDKGHTHGLANLHGNVPCAKKCNCTTQDFTAHFNGTTYLQGPVAETLVQCAPGQKP